MALDRVLSDMRRANRIGPVCGLLEVILRIYGPAQRRQGLADAIFGGIETNEIGIAFKDARTNSGSPGKVVVDFGPPSYEPHPSADGSERISRQLAENGSSYLSSNSCKMCALETWKIPGIGLC